MIFSAKSHSNFDTDLNFRLHTESLLPSTAGSRETTSVYCNYTRLDYGRVLIQSVLFSRRHTNVASALFKVLNSVQFVVCLRLPATALPGPG